MQQIFKSTKKIIVLLFSLAIVLGFFLNKVPSDMFFQLTTLVIGTYLGFSINKSS